MPAMPKKATKTPKSTDAKINKSAWIRSQPASMSAGDVVEKAKAEGISLTANQVYTTRSNAKTAKTSKGGKKPTASGGGATAEQLIRRAALLIGIEGLEAVVKKIRTEAGI
jgi:hypothetical protein